MFTIQNLTASLNDKIILNNFNLEINQNQIHILMGPNGCGKSTLSKIIAGDSLYKINKGDILLHNQSLINLSADVRALNGLFLGFQNPVEIPGVNNFEFLHFIYNKKKTFLGESRISPIEFLSILEPYLIDLQIKKDFLGRSVNYGFSGGEKKKNEILQMLLLSPDMIILDELDSGVDIDALKLIFSAILKYRKKNSSFLIISHSLKILNYIDISFVHLMSNGQIKKTGKKELINYVENFGYSGL